MSEHTFKVQIWGCRGSYPTPGKDTVQYGGNTTCVEVSIGNCILVFDAGTGIISLGKELARLHRETGQPLTVNLFFSHIHHDHIEGFPFFEPAYLHSTTINIFGSNLYADSLLTTISNAMLPPYFPVEFSEMYAKKAVQEVGDADTVFFSPDKGIPKGLKNPFNKIIPEENDIHVRVLRGYAHPKGGIHIYSVLWKNKKFVFATDTEGYIGSDQRLVKFASKADLLIHDAQFTQESYCDPVLPKQGWGHSTVNMAVEVAQKAQVKRLVLTHHDPGDTDSAVTEKEHYAQRLFPASECAREGQSFYL